MLDSLQAYLIDAYGTKMALLKVPILLVDGLPDIPYTVEYNGWFAVLKSTNPVTYRWINSPTKVDIIKKF